LVQKSLGHPLFKLFTYLQEEEQRRLMVWGRAINSNNIDKATALAISLCQADNRQEPSNVKAEEDVAQAAA
jgi:hypothetical protein